LGAARPGHEIVGKIHVKQLYEIAKIKRRDEHMQKFSLETLCLIIQGSCRSMGIEVVGGDKGTAPKWSRSWEDQMLFDEAEGLRNA
jgi:hypothetical protein